MPKKETPNEETPHEQFERERMNRRSALRKLGFGAGLSAFALLGVDDLARMVGKELAKRAGDNAIASEVAREFQRAGVVGAVVRADPDGACDYPCQECAGTFKGTCNQHGNYGMSGISCCQEECNKCCEKQVTNSNGTKHSACGSSPSEVEGNLTICHDRCKAYYGAPI